MKREQRAQQLWSVLVLAAKNRQVLTYDLVGKACGVPAAALGDYLRPIQQYCVENRMPPLTSLVVSKESGMPGSGFSSDGDVPFAQNEVFNWDWLSKQAPNEDELATAYKNAPDAR